MFHLILERMFMFLLRSSSFLRLFLRSPKESINLNNKQALMNIHHNQLSKIRKILLAFGQL